MALDYNIIGKRIRDIRLEKKLTQEDLALRMNVSIPYLSRVEKGSAHLNLVRLNQICRILNVTEGYLLNGASLNNSQYLTREFSDLLKTVSPETERLIYEVAKLIAAYDPYDPL